MDTIKKIKLCTSRNYYKVPHEPSMGIINVSSAITMQYGYGYASHTLSVITVR